MNILIFTLQERQAPIMSDAARRKERELAQKEVSTNEKVTLASIENFCAILVVDDFPYPFALRLPYHI